MLVRRWGGGGSMCVTCINRVVAMHIIRVSNHWSILIQSDWLIARIFQWSPTSFIAFLMPWHVVTCLHELTPLWWEHKWLDLISPDQNTRNGMWYWCTTGCNWRVWNISHYQRINTENVQPHTLVCSLSHKMWMYMQGNTCFKAALLRIEAEEDLMYTCTVITDQQT